MQDVSSRTISHHRQRSRRIAHGSGKETARNRNIHLGNYVVVPGRLTHDAFKNRVRLGISSQPSVELSEAQVDKQEFLPLIPVLKDRRISICAPHAPVTA